MSIINYLDLFVGALINSLTAIIIVKNNFYKTYKKSKYMYLVIIIYSILGALVNVYNRSTFKVLIILPVMMLLIKRVFNVTAIKSFTLSIVVMFYMFMSEILLTIFIGAFGIEELIFNNNVLGGTIGNILVSITTLLLLKIKVLSKYFKNIFNFFNEKSIFVILIYFALLVAFISYKNFANINNLVDVIANTLITTFFMVIVYFLFNEHQKTLDISKEYNSLLLYLNEYEKEIIEKRKIIHDFNNELIIINEYADPNNKKLKKYLRTLMNNQKKITSKSIITKLDYLPNGLKGLMCYKLIPVQDKIKIIISADPKLKDYIIDDNVLADYLKIVGIFIDNAIEASLICIDALIKIDLNMIDKELKLKIENNFNGEININKIFETGYSTKGTKRGYGLSLVDDIEKENDRIKKAINVQDSTFIAELNLK